MANRCYDLEVIEDLRKIMIDWQISLAELAQISGLNEENLKSFLSSNASNDQASLSNATVAAGFEALVPLIAIWKKLKLKYPNPEDQNKWLTTPHPDFENHKPLVVMAMSPEHMSWVAYYLDSSLKNS